MTMQDDKKAAQKWLRDNNKCGSKSQDDFLCTLTVNHIGREHQAQIMGGPEDGKTLAKWPW